MENVLLGVLLLIRCLHWTLKLIESSRLVRTLTLGLDADIMGLEPGTNDDYL